MAIFYFRRIRRKKVNKNNLWMFEEFPYKYSLGITLKKGGMRKVISFMNSLNKEYADKNNTPFFNFCKIFIEGNNPELSKQVQHAEAMIRFLSGSALAFVISSVSWFILGIFTIPKFGIYSIIFSAISLILLIIILERFRLQRRREVYMVWSIMYLILNGAVSTTCSNNLSEMQKSVSFEI